MQCGRAERVTERTEEGEEEVSKRERERESEDGGRGSWNH
jgi:hypothetical protein